MWLRNLLLLLLRVQWSELMGSGAGTKIHSRRDLQQSVIIWWMYAAPQIDILNLGILRTVHGLWSTVVIPLIWTFHIWQNHEVHFLMRGKNSKISVGNHVEKWIGRAGKIIQPALSGCHCRNRRLLKLKSWWQDSYCGCPRHTWSIIGRTGCHSYQIIKSMGELLLVGGCGVAS